VIAVSLAAHAVATRDTGGGSVPMIGTTIRPDLAAWSEPAAVRAYNTGRIDWGGPASSSGWSGRRSTSRRGFIRLEVRTTKNNKGREFPFTALPELAELRAQRAATTALGHRQGRIIWHVFHREGQAITSFRHAWQAAVTRAALPCRLPHDFRRTAVRNLVRPGSWRRSP
jgi:hypothetical protein